MIKKSPAEHAGHRVGTEKTEIKLGPDRDTAAIASM
jgi:hypothetical protein